MTSITSSHSARTATAKTPKKHKATSAHNSTENRRKRKERFFRFILRRRPCYLVFFVELGVAAAFVVAFIYLIAKHHSIMGQQDVLSKHDEIYERKTKEKSTKHCSFVNETDFDTSECSYRCDSDAFIVRKFAHFGEKKQKKKKADSCATKFELLRCSEAQNCLADAAIFPATEIIETACLGKKNGYMRRHHVAPITIPMVPKVNLTEESIGKQIYANELIARCPRCRVRSQWAKKSKDIRCDRSLATLQEGWPADFRLCNYVEHGNCEDLKLQLNQDGQDNY